MKIRIKFRDLGILATVLLAIVAIMQVSATAVYLGQTTINVTVTDLSQVSIKPTTLNFSAQPGAQATDQDIEIWNIGSNNISNIYVSADTVTDETSNPITGGVAENFASAGFLALKNASDDDFYYVGRLEWNLSLPLSRAAYGGKRYNSTGFFRNVSGNYMWQLANNGSVEDGWCNTTGTEFWIETDVDAATAATRTPTGSSANFTWDEGQDEWGLFSSVGGPLDGHCVATYWDCTKIYIYHWDMNTTFDGCTNSSYIQTAKLTPGNYSSITATALVSQGVPDGVTEGSLVTIHGTAA